MNDNDPFETELRNRFTSLRRLETESAPSFARMTLSLRQGRTVPDNTAWRLRAFPVLVPIAAAAMLALIIIIPMLVNRNPARTSLFSSLPVLLEPRSPDTSLFAEMQTPGSPGFMPSDDLLPLQLRIKL